MGWDDAAGYDWEFVGSNRYDSFSFRLTGAVNDSPAWDNQGGDITLNIIWDVFAL